MTKHANRTKRLSRRAIYVAHEDRVRLEGLLRRTRSGDAQEARYLDALAGELARAKVKPRARLPASVVAMNSAVRLRDPETGEEETYTLVFPEEADINENKLSVLAPVGTALLGYRAGDVVEWPVPAGLRKVYIEAVFPPEPALL